MRSLREMVQSQALPEDLRMPSDMLQAVSGALMMVSCGFSQLWRTNGSWYKAQARNAETRVALIHAWHDEVARWLADLHGQPRAITRLLTRQAVVAVALVTYRFSPQAAQEFWRGVASDDRLGQKDPRKALLLYLIDKSPTGISPAMYSRYVASAWNSWCHNRPRNNLRLTKTPTIQIDHTPHTGQELLVYLDAEGMHHEPVALDPAQARLPLIAA
jgi:hypothetical protein